MFGGEMSYTHMTDKQEQNKTIQFSSSQQLCDQLCSLVLSGWLAIHFVIDPLLNIEHG